MTALFPEINQMCAVIDRAYRTPKPRQFVIAFRQGR